MPDDKKAAHHTLFAPLILPYREASQSEIQWSSLFRSCHSQSKKIQQKNNRTNTTLKTDNG
jgi:hypothetical protein